MASSSRSDEKLHLPPDPTTSNSNVFKALDFLENPVFRDMARKFDEIRSGEISQDNLRDLIDVHRSLTDQLQLFQKKIDEGMRVRTNLVVTDLSGAAVVSVDGLEVDIRDWDFVGSGTVEKRKDNLCLFYQDYMRKG